MSTHHQLHLPRSLVFVIAGALCTLVLSAQISLQVVTDQDIGRPPPAPFITFLGIVAYGKLATDPSLPVNGPVAEVLYEELRAQKTPAGPAGEVVTSIRTRYDAEGRAIEELRNEWRSETNTINRYQGTRLVSQESTFPNSKTPIPKFWSYWVYDQSGKLIEYRRGSGNDIQNHYTNFKRDGQGRLLSFEERQGAKDALFSRTELRYSGDGKTVDDIFSVGGEVKRSTTQTVDDQGHVVLAVIREQDWRTKKPKAPLKIAFRYDEKGRLLEQNTDANEFEGSRREQEVPPGKISITYDDVKRTRTTAYSSDDELLALTVTFDESGAVIGMAGGIKNAPVDVMLECTYDSHRNWTTCRQMDKRAGVSTVGKIWRRTITYRSSPP